MYVTPLNGTLKGLTSYVIPFYHSLKNGKKTEVLQDSKTTMVSVTHFPLTNLLGDVTGMK